MKLSREDVTFTSSNYVKKQNISTAFAMMMQMAGDR